jgi:hypothetical protein
VRFRFNRSGVIAALALAVALGGCANVDFDTAQNWFSKPLDIGGRNAGGYTFSELAETKQRQRPVTPNDLVDANGGCPARAQPQPPAAAPGTQATSALPVPDTASLLGGGIALGMNECDVVFRAGQPSAVQIGKSSNGDRSAVLTFNAGPRPGVYRFERGTLTEMDRAAQTSNPPPEKKKAAKSTKPQKKNNQT